MKLRVTPLSGFYSKILMDFCSSACRGGVRKGSPSTHYSTFPHVTVFYNAHNQHHSSMPDWARREPRPEAVLCFYPNPLVPILKVMLQVKSNCESRSAWPGRSATSERKQQRMIHRSEDLTEKLLKLWPFLQNACAIVVIGLTHLTSSSRNWTARIAWERLGANPFWS